MVTAELVHKLCLSRCVMYAPGCVLPPGVVYVAHTKNIAWLDPHLVYVNMCLPICKQSDVYSMQPLLTYRAIHVNNCY
jgi:hypothetical protein